LVNCIDRITKGVAHGSLTKGVARLVNCIDRTRGKFWCILGRATPRVKPSANLDTWRVLVHPGQGYAEGKTLGKSVHVAGSGASWAVVRRG
jgi:hypothetical protein